MDEAHEFSVVEAVDANVNLPSDTANIIPVGDLYINGEKVCKVNLNNIEHSKIEVISQGKEMMQLIIESLDNNPDSVTVVMTGYETLHHRAELNTMIRKGE